MSKIKVINVVDKRGTALDRLAKGAIPYMKNVEYHVVDVHPKKPSVDQLVRFEELAKDADLIDAHYFRTIENLRTRYEWLREKPTILSHFNPYSVTESDWNDYDLVVGCNQEIYKRLGEITQSPVEYVPLTVDTDFWTFNTEWSPNNRVIMVANRIEGKKGILPVAQACKKIGAKLVLVGNVSDPDYFHEVIQTGNVEIAQNVTDEELRRLYYGASVHVCNSVDNFESGTLPILEAMLCGVPVLTREVGHVPDMNNGENMVILDGQPEDIDGIAEKLNMMLEDAEKLRDLRDKAWQTAKARSNERRAYIYQKLYRQVLYPNQRPVTVITPVCDKAEITEQNVKSVASQTYKNIEHILINDGEEKQPEPQTPFGLVLRNYQNDYGLARARNKAIIEATGEVIIFCDQRIIMEPDAIERFVENLQPGKWLWGSKNGIKKEMVENFSCVERDAIIRRGMFCERIDRYGALSQYARSMAKLNGMRLEYIESAKAQQIGKSSNRNRRRSEIIKSKTQLWKMNLEG